MARRQLWGGNFSAPPSEVLKKLNDSFSFDRALLEEDIEGSIAWTAALRRAGALTPAEARKITGGLVKIREKGIKEPGATDAEDVHSFVEAALALRIGPLAGKLHTGRSRNDQVATDLRLYLMKALREGRGWILDLAGVLARRAREEASSPMPGYTHMKRAIPVTFGHWAHAYVEMLLRDADRFASSRARADECPLGSGALAGTPLTVDRAALARSLGFSRPTANSIDAVSDRDAAAEYLFAASLLLSHMSRLAEDLLLFSSDEFGFVELPDSLSTGSSRMPHKKNPDILELVRGHAGRAIGELAGLLAVLKGLPLAYDKDLQLDKEPVFRTRAVLSAALPAMTALLAGMSLDRGRMREAASDVRLLVTELADALAARGMPFRKAHEIVGRRLAEAGPTNRPVLELGPGAGITRKDLLALDVDRALSKRRTYGGTAPAAVRRAARASITRIARLRRQR